jgi:hypothetical protein
MAFKTLGATTAPNLNDSKTILEGDNDLQQIFDDLKESVTAAYNCGTTMEEAEKLAGRCLGAQLDIAKALSSTDLDTRMKKNGMKAAKAQAYMTEVGKYDKKPSDTLIENAVALDSMANKAVDLYETADAKKEELTLYFGIFKDAHIYFRTIAKGTFNG